MKEFINFMLNPIDQLSDLNKLQEVLENTGIEAKIVAKKSGEQEFSFLSIVYDSDVVRTKKKRNAGRPYKSNKGRYTYGEIRAMQVEMSNRDIAALLELSERTFYRRLKEYENETDDVPFV